MANLENSTDAPLKMTSSDENHDTVGENGVLKDTNGKDGETSKEAQQKNGSENFLKLTTPDPSEAPQYSMLYHKGLMFLRESVLEIEDIGKMEIREDDIWVCSFPRSGTTMTQELVYLIQTLDFETANTVLLDARFPMIDLLIKEVPFYRGLKMVEKLPSPRFIKSHLQHFLLPEQLRSGKGKIIYTARNLPDTLWSSYQFAGFIGRKQSFEKYFKRFLAGREPYTPWGRHVREFWDHRNDENILFLKFEDTVKDMPRTVRKIAEYLNRKLSEEDIKKICDHCSIENMKKNQMTNGDYGDDYAADTSIEYNKNHGGLINTGIGGAWRDHVTEEMNALMNEEMEKHFAGSGLTFNTKWSFFFFKEMTRQTMMFRTWHITFYAQEFL